MYFISAYVPAKAGKFTERELKTAYLAEAAMEASVEDKDKEIIESFLLGVYREPDEIKSLADERLHEVYAGKKYKPVALKVRPVYAELPDQYRIKREIKGDPLAGMPPLNPKPRDFEPMGRYTQERKDEFDKVHGGDFLWTEERKLIHNVMMDFNDAFAWDDSERGHFREDFFPPVVIPTVEHTPWVHKNIPIPPGIYEEVCKMVQKKKAAGTYEPSNSSYRSRWFTVIKKDGKSLRIVHSLEPLNAVTIAHSGVPPATEDVATHFAGRACGGMFDLFVGYDERMLAEVSRDLTTFQTPFGAMRLTTLPMGWTNSVPIFHDDVTSILQPEIPEYTIPYIDDVPVRGPASTYQDVTGKFETIPENKGIRKFVWEHIGNVCRILQRMRYCHGTFSGTKSLICAEEITVLGHRCTPHGRVPEEGKLDAIMKWDICENASQVRSFLGTAGVLRSHIPGFAQRAHHLKRLTHHNVTFEWGEDQIKSMESLKEGARQAACLRAIDYENHGDVVLAVDTSWMAVGYYIYQEDKDDPKKHYYVKFGSILLNEREARFSQPKRELFGLKRALESNRKLLYGVRKLVVETDAKYLEGMLNNPDVMPNATINRWIDQVTMYHFTLRHKPGISFGPDGLSRRPKQPRDEPQPHIDDDDDIPNKPPDFEMADENDERPLSIEEFVDTIDNRGGYFHGIATSIDDFGVELDYLDTLRVQEKAHLQNIVKETRSLSQKVYVQQLVNTLVLPEESAELEPYNESRRSSTALQQDKEMPLLNKMLKNKSYRPRNLTDKQIKRLLRLREKFILYKDKLYRRGKEGQHRLYVDKARRMYLITAAHDHNGHKGFFATKGTLVQRFWWPEMEADIKWFVKTCQPCQERQLQLIKIPPTLTHTPSLFQILHADVMHMTPVSNGCKYIVHGRDSLSSWVEARALKKESAKNIALWLYEDILCRWGSLHTIVTDNGTPFIAATDWLHDKYGIVKVRISPYNSQANGKIERPHWDLRQMLYKATGANNTSKWYWFLNAVLWADRTSIRKRMGCSPYFLVTGAHPTLPLDVKEATWLIELPTGVLTEEELIGCRARALAKHRLHIDEMRARVDKNKLIELKRYEADHKAVIRDHDFKPGDLVLIRNTSVEKSLDSKMKPRYMGPMIIISRRKGGSYIVSEMTGAVWQNKVAAFRVIPYYPRRSIEIPDGVMSIIDTNEDGLRLIDSMPDEEFEVVSRDYLMDNVHLDTTDEKDNER